MPYITQAARERLPLEIPKITTQGELNYVLTQVLLKYLDIWGISYRTINDCVGALECCKLEAYRRLGVEIERDKMRINGDVFPAYQGDNP